MNEGSHRADLSGPRYRAVTSRSDPHTRNEDSGRRCAPPTGDIAGQPPFPTTLTGCGDGVDVFSRTGSQHGRSVADTFASVYSLAYPEATLELLAAAEKLLGLTGDDVALCPRYGEGTAP